MRHIITLSTIPPRFAGLGPALQSLLAQSSRPEAVEVYIPNTYRRFPQWGGALPAVPDGVRIVRTDADLGPATKILPAARAYRGQEVELLYVDDDTVFAPNWAEKSLALRKAHPGAAICAGATTLQRLGRNWTAHEPQPRSVPAPFANQQVSYHLRRLLAAALQGRATAVTLSTPARKLDRSGYADIAEGYGGVGIRPEFLDDEAVRNIPPVLWSVDDIWLSGHMARKGVPIWADQSLNLSRTVLEVSRTQSLFRAVIDGADRPSANLACIDYMRATYGVWGGAATQSA